MVLWTEVTTCHAVEHTDQHDGAQGDMKAMEACEQEKGIPINTRIQTQTFF